MFVHLSEIRPISPTLDDDLVRTKLEDHNYTAATEVHPKTSLINNKNKIKEKHHDSYSTTEVSGKSVLNSPRERDLLLSKEPSQESASSPVVVRRHPPGRPAARIVKVSPASQELLMKLFEGVEGDKGPKKVTGPNGPRKIRWAYTFISILTFHPRLSFCS